MLYNHYITKVVIILEIFKLFGSIFVDNEKANKSISETDQKAQGLGGKLAGMIGTAAKWGAGIAAAGATAVTGMVALANKTAESADEIDKMAERTGIGRERLQELRYAAGQSDVEFSVLEKAVKKMSETSVLAADGSKKASEAFEMLGISLHNTDGSLKSTNQLFEESMNALADMEEGVQRNYIGNQLFGRGFTEMLPLLNAGSDGIQELSDRARDLGLVMSEEAVVANVVFGDTLSDLKQSLGSVFMHISNQFLPILQIFIDFVLAHMPQIQAVFQTVFGVIEILAKSFIQGIQNIISWVTQWANDNQEKVTQIKELFLNFFEAVQGFITAFVEFATAFWREYGDEISAITEKVFGFITSTIETALKIVTEIFNVFAALFRGDWEALGDSVKKIWNLLWEWLKGTGKIVFDIGKNIVQALWDGIKSMWSNLTSWVGNKVSGLLNKLNPFKGGGIKISGPNIPGLAEGGTVLQSGMTLVGEAGPELLHLPRGAQVAPLGAGGYGTANIIFEVDGRTLAKLIGQPLTEEIRLRTGLKL